MKLYSTLIQYPQRIIFWDFFPIWNRGQPGVIGNRVTLSTTGNTPTPGIIPPPRQKPQPEPPEPTQGGVHTSSAHGQVCTLRVPIVECALFGCPHRYRLLTGTVCKGGKIFPNSDFDEIRRKGFVYHCDDFKTIAFSSRFQYFNIRVMHKSLCVGGVSGWRFAYCYDY